MRKLITITVLFAFLLASCGGTATQQIGTVTPQQAYDTIQANQGDPNFELIDVRTPDEYQSGKIAGAVDIDFYAADFQQQLSQLDRNKQYLIYCHTGNRSGQALTIMKNLGFQNVEDIGGGIAAWAQQGLPIAP
ncbi:MAG: rhodanese-like domain-containing protein [Acidimicrobiia bacterium]